jgi:hypothetical protein
VNGDPDNEFESLIARLMRSIDAGSPRRQAMRDELLSHLRQAYEDELSQGRDESTAVQVALRRFGDLAALQLQLQESIPWFERWLAHLFDSKEIVMSIGPRVAGWVMSLIGAAFLFGLAVVLPAVAKLGQAVPTASQSAQLVGAPKALKLSLTSLLAFSVLVMLVGLATLGYAFVTRKKPARG